MQKIKVFFFLIYIQNLIAYQNKYCEICPNHILCKYQDAGPNPLCLGYEEKSLLTQDQIKTIVNQINIRRNFIALGQSNFFHTAANMKKIVWSNELAIYAQRWVDQCNQSLRPDLEDQCRDMEKTKVGQNIATITGLSPGVNVKSFVEIWFMLSMDYVGSVTYYNQSRDSRSKYFTQLIWADTDKVGCGKARFFVKNIKLTLVERLVCNFAPRGNVHGKPIYTIGYPATQCDDNMISDEIFPGLCSYDAKAARLSSVNTAATSLLRIRNLFNDMTKQEIDPVRSDFKQTTISSKITSSKQKKYGVPEGSYDFIKRSYPLESDHWTSHKNNSRPLSDYLRQQEKGHSKLYHSHDHKDEFDYLHPMTTSQDSGRYDFTTSLKHQHDINYRKHNIKDQCTRKSNSQINNDALSMCDCKQKTFKCTRSQKTNYQTFTKKYTTCSESTTHPNLNNECACEVTPTSCHNINHYAQNRNCDCDVKCCAQRCAGLLKSLENPETDSSETYNKFLHYDLRKEETKKGKQITSYAYDSVTAREVLRRLNKRKNMNSDYSEIKGHFAEDDTNFKPFWELDDFKNKKQLPLKSLFYTTLSNKKISRSKRTKSTLKIFTTTEPITIKNIDRQDKTKHITEKYLSFEELMHLRKNNSSSYNIRRLNDEMPNEREDKAILRDAPTTTAQSTSEYTANTPYIRLKYCTRKLTCTWTAASLTDSEGSIIPGGQGGNIGTRTPPGYVEGCTRTSTCTRDFMDRNKMATLPIETTSPEIDTDDEDYCERRSLNKRNSNVIDLFQEYESKFRVINKKLNLSVFKELPQTKSFNECNCSKDIVRNKRHHNMNHSSTINLLNYRNIKRENIRELLNNENTVMSYGDLFYLVLNKILETWKSNTISHSRKRCSCNNDDKLKLSYLLLFITVLAIK